MPSTGMTCWLQNDQSTGLVMLTCTLMRLREPVVAVAAPPLLQEPGARDRLAQLRLRLADLALLLLRVGTARQIDPMMEGILEEAHPDPAGVRLVEVLVEEDHVDGQLAGGVVGANAFDQGPQVAVVDLVEAQPVAAPRAVPAAVVVDPEHVVVLGRPDVAQQLPLELLVDDVVVLVAPAELLPDGALDQRVELRLGLELLRTLGEPDREPAELRGLPDLGHHAPALLHLVQQLLVHPEDTGMGRRRSGAALVQPEQQRLARPGREAARGVGILDAPELAVVGEDHLVEQDLARLGRDPASRLAALAGRTPAAPPLAAREKARSSSWW